MNFTNKAPTWNAEGQEPTNDLQEQGFVAGYKPPAAYFNYMFNKYMKCINEAQEKIIELSNIKDSMQGAIDELTKDTVLPRYKDIYPNKVGWYRIAQIKLSNLAALKGSTSNSCEIEFKRNFANNPTEYKKIQMVSIYEATKFCDEISKGSNLITRIRHTIDTTNMIGYIEIYYNATNGNSTLVTLSNHRNLIGVEWELIVPQLTEETVDGVTVLGSHDFTYNYDVQTQLDTKINKNIFTSWSPVGQFETAYLASGNSTELGFSPNRVFLLTIFNEFNVGCLYIVETGRASTAKITPIKEHTAHFTLTAVSKTNISIKATNANGYISYMCIGGHDF